jgi:MFS family permease
MLASISPLGERARGQRFGITATAYVIGSIAGGALVGGLLGALGQLALAGVSVAVRAGILGLLALAAVLLDRRERRIPSWHRQVNEDWLSEYRGWVYGLGFGFQLGLGVVTIVTTASVYLTWAAALLSGSTPAGIVIGLAFGLARALPIFGGLRVGGPDQLAARVGRLDRWDGNFRVVTVLVEALAACAFLAVVVL